MALNPTIVNQPQPNQAQPGDNNAVQPPEDNNASLEDEFASFWDQETDAPEQQQQQQQQQQQSVGDQSDRQTVDSILDGLPLATQIPTEVTQQLAEGDTSGLGQIMQQNARTAVEQTLMLTGQMLQRMQTQMNDRMEQVINSRLTDHSNREFMDQSLGIAQDPSMKPIVEGIFATALKRSNGNKQQAVDMTKRFLSRVATSAGAETGMSVQNQNPHQRSRDEDVDWTQFFVSDGKS